VPFLPSWNEAAAVRVLLTGAGGFAGHHVLEHIFTTTDWDVVATDNFRHRGKTDRVAQILEPNPEWRQRLTVITHDLAAPFTEQTASRIGSIGYVIAMASESHVDRSIDDPVPFVRNNVSVILNTLQLARTLQPKAVIVISTDEVYGPIIPAKRRPPNSRWLETEMMPHAEWSPVLPSNPYAASKAAQEAIAISYWRTYGTPVIIINCMNLIGERQDPEKYLPMLIRGISRGDEVTIHGTRGNIGSRHYLHARNLGDALVYILRELPPAAYPAAHRPSRYNVVGPDRVTNLELAERVASAMRQPLRYRLVDFHSARPGHDPHYGLDHTKLTGLGWKPPVPFGESLTRTVNWTLANPEWLL